AEALAAERGMQLAEPPRIDACGLARVEKGLLGALEPRLELQRLVQRLDGTLGREEPPACDPADAPAFLGELLAAREVDARNLEQRHRVDAEIDVVAGGREQAVEERRAQHPELRRNRLGDDEGSWVAVGGLQRPGVRLRVTGSDEHVL